MKSRLLIPIVPVLTGLAIAAAPAAAATPEAISENWAGYEATSSSANGFSTVSGGWVQPTATCTSGNATYGAFWVGLGGGEDSSTALEQIGTQSDCAADGSTSYYAWYELVPSAPVKLGLKISPGDRIYSRVSVSGSSVTLSLSDQTTGQSFSKTLTMAVPTPDTTTAEWIAEAPSACQGGASGQCAPLPLTDFGTVKFDSAYATASGQTQSASGWSAEAIALDSVGGGALPSSLSSDGSSFSVAYSSGNGDGDGYGGGYGYGGYGGYGGGYGYGGYGGGYGYGYGGSYGGYSPVPSVSYY